MHAHNQAENLLKMCLFLGKGEFLKKILKQTITNAWILKKKSSTKKMYIRQILTTQKNNTAMQKSNWEYNWLEIIWLASKRNRNFNILQI